MPSVDTQRQRYRESLVASNLFSGEDATHAICRSRGLLSTLQDSGKFTIRDILITRYMMQFTRQNDQLIRKEHPYAMTHVKHDTLRYSA